jgi:hypothetical protein
MVRCFTSADGSYLINSSLQRSNFGTSHAQSLRISARYPRGMHCWHRGDHDHDGHAAASRINHVARATWRLTTVMPGPVASSKRSVSSSIPRVRRTLPD